MNTMHQVILTQAEIEIAAAVGRLRRVESIRQGLIPAHGFDGHGYWDIDIEGAGAELAYAKSRGRYWGGCVNTFKGADVGTNVQIRSTKRKDGCLIVRDDDPEDHYFVLVTGEIPKFRVVGWMLGEDAKQERWAKEPNGRERAYFVPQGELNRFE